jgi:MFS family permease
MTLAATVEPHARHQSKKAAASGWIGSALEYYDFFIYATAASLIFPQLFFPSGNPTVAIVASLATYGVGYVARPIGAFFLGHWGDTHGRKNVLILCMFLMVFSTMAVGLLPTYEQTGVLAPTLLVILRLIQGFAVAGEISGASSMILEHAPFGRRGSLPPSRFRACRRGKYSRPRFFCRSQPTCLPISSIRGAGAFRSCSASL